MEQVKHKNISHEVERGIYYVRIMINFHYYLKAFKNLEDAIEYRDALIAEHRPAKEEKQKRITKTESDTEPCKRGRPVREYTLEEFQAKQQKDRERRKKHYEANKEAEKARYQQNKEKIKERYLQKKAAKLLENENTE